MNARKPITPENAYLRLATLCAQSEQAEGDLRKKLHDWGIGGNDINAIIARLKQEKYLDNDRFARAYCNDKLRFNGWGRIKIAFMLRSKGIEQGIINDALEQIDENLYLDVLDKVLTAKVMTLTSKTPEQARASLMRFAASRGFEPAVFIPVVSRIIDSHED